MAAIINPKLTDAGKAAAINANANGIQLAITHVALGTGKYDSAATGAGMTAMAARVEQVLVGSGIVTGAGGFRLNIKFLPYEGTPNPYDVTELGFYAGDPAAGGILFAVYSSQSDVIVQRNSLIYLAQFAMQITDVPPGSITIVVDPDSTEALAMLALHEGAADPHPVYVKKKGDTSTGPQIGVTAPQHSAGKMFTTAEFVKRVGLSYPAEGGIGITVNTTLAVEQLGRWADFQVAGVSATLPKTSDSPVGGSIEFRVSAASGLIVAQSGDVLFAPLVGVVSTLQVIQGETVRVSRNAAGYWEVIGTSARLPAGIVSYFAGASPPPGWLKLNGTTLPRAAYPMLWLYAQSQGVVTDADFLNNGYSGRFSSGTNGSDFRIPDARGTFLRALDDGRGIDTGRSWGTYQDHANRSHAHGLVDPGHTHALYDPGHAHGVNDAGHAHSAWTDAQGQHVHGGAIPPNVPGPGYVASFGITPSWNLYGGGVNVDAAGNHAHNVGIGASGTGVSIQAAGTNIAVQARGTGITMQADGTESRPKNIAWSLCVKF